MYTAPLEITQSTKIKAALFQDDKPSEVVYENIIRFHKAWIKKLTMLQNLMNGILEMIPL